MKVIFVFQSVDDIEAITLEDPKYGLLRQQLFDAVKRVVDLASDISTLEIVCDILAELSLTGKSILWDESRQLSITIEN